ncbi:MAG: DNA polymerase III subunit beta [Planctomycetota bacterium]|jgi:DNA polymerase-3 subunit beta|nr:DNA polymerase III subunit beta [Planctomycetota bacterium]
MEFTVNKAAFSDALSLISSIVPERSARMVLQNLLLRGGDDGDIFLSATDLEISLRVRLDVSDLKEPAPVLLPASRLNAIVRGIGGDDLKIEVDDLKLTIRNKYGRFQMPGADVIDYPTIPEFKEENAVFIHGDDFVDAVKKTIFATAKGDTRYALNGIYMNVHDNHCEFVASDTHRLALVKKKIRNPDDSAFEGIILTKGMAILSRLASGRDVVEINITPNDLLARTPNATLAVRRVEGMFPRYADVVPAKSENHFKVNREEMLKSLHSVGLMASEETRSIQFLITPGAVTLSAKSENGEGVITLDAEVHGGGGEIKFNYQFLVDLLKIHENESVDLQYKDSESPARIDAVDYLYVIMPINR